MCVEEQRRRCGATNTLPPPSPTDTQLCRHIFTSSPRTQPTVTSTRERIECDSCLDDASPSFRRCHLKQKIFNSNPTSTTLVAALSKGMRVSAPVVIHGRRSLFVLSVGMAPYTLLAAISSSATTSSLKPPRARWLVYHAAGGGGVKWD